MDNEQLIQTVYADSTSDPKPEKLTLKESVTSDKQMEWMMQTVNRLSKQIEHLNREQETLKVQCQRDRTQLNKLNQELNQIKNRKFFQ